MSDAHTTLRDQFHDEPVHDALEAYALGALVADDCARFEAHLPTCDACRTELRAIRPLVGLLPYGLPPRRPPAGVRERLLARARTEVDGPPTIGVDPTEAPTIELASIPVTAQETPRRPRNVLASLGWAAALAFVLGSGLVVGAWAATGPHASPEMELFARLPGGRILSLLGTGAPTAGARLYVIEDGRRAELTVDALPPLPPGRAYQLWFAEPGQPIRTGGTFVVNSQGDTVAVVTIPAPIARMNAVFITQEPAAGSPGPTGPHLLDWTP